MKAFGFWVLFMAVGTALVFLALNQNRLPQRKTAIVQSSAPRRKGTLDNMKLEDYHTIDPIPSSKVTRAGPIEHCSPLICRIPHPTPPCPYRSSKQTGSPFSESSPELPLLLLLAKKICMT